MLQRSLIRKKRYKIRVISQIYRKALLEFIEQTIALSPSQSALIDCLETFRPEFCS